MDPSVESILLLTRAPWLLPRCCPSLPIRDGASTVLDEGRCQRRTVRARLRCRVECGRCGWRHLPARQVILSSWTGDTVHCWLQLGAAMAPCTRRGPSVPLCGSLWPSLWPSLDRRPAAPLACSCRCALAPPIGWRHQLTASSDPRSRCLQIMPTRRPPTNSQCCSNLARSALCSASSHPQRTTISKQATGWQCSAVPSRAAPTLLGTQKSVPARRPAGLQQTVSSFNPGRCPSPLPFSNSPSPP